LARHESTTCIKLAAQFFQTGGIAFAVLLHIQSWFRVIVIENKNNSYSLFCQVNG
jgi:hypothetical protein